MCVSVEWNGKEIPPPSLPPFTFHYLPFARQQQRSRLRYEMETKGKLWEWNIQGMKSKRFSLFKITDEKLIQVYWFLEAFLLATFASPSTPGMLLRSVLLFSVIFIGQDAERNFSFFACNSLKARPLPTSLKTFFLLLGHSTHEHVGRTTNLSSLSPPTDWIHGHILRLLHAWNTKRKILRSVVFPLDEGKRKN